MFPSFVTSMFSHGLRQLGSRNLDTDTTHEEGIEHGVDAVLEIYIDFIDKDFDHIAVLDPFIRFHICSEDGRYISAITKQSSTTQRSDTRIFNEPRGHTFKMKKQNSSHDNEGNHTFVWEERILINERYTRIIDESVVFLFEVIDTINSSTLQNPWVDADYQKIAWGYLKPFGRHRNFNIGQNVNDTRSCRLQLFKYQRNSIFVRHRAKQWNLLSDSNVPDVFLQYLRMSYNPLDQSLYIRAGPTILNSLPNQKEKASKRFDSVSQEKSISMISSEPEVDKKFRRNYNDRCLIPDNILYKLETNGSDAVKFSSSGNHLAVASQTLKVCVYDVECGQMIFNCKFHTDMVTDLIWCDRDIYLFSASMDGTIVVYQIGEKLDRYRDVDQQCDIQTTIFPLSFLPAVPTKLTFVSIQDSKGGVIPFLVSSHNHSLKLWNIHDESFAGELGGGKVHHYAPVNAITKDNSNSRIYSGDDAGCIIIWKLSTRNNLAATMNGEDYDVLQRIDGLRNLNGRSIRNLDLCTIGTKRLLVTTDDKNLSLYDFTSQSMIQFCSEAKMRKHAIATAVFSPDGNFVASGTREGKILFMESSTGMSITSKLSKKELKFELKAIDWNETRHVIAVCFDGTMPVLVFSAPPMKTYED